MDLRLKDKVIVVTGGSQGIGEGISRCLAEEGAIPMIIGRSEEKGLAVVEDIHKSTGIKAEFIKAELSEYQQCIDGLRKVTDGYGRIDGLVNNAGINDSVGLEHGNPEKFLQSLNKNLYHYYYMAHLALPFLKKTKGSIVNVSSKTAFTGQGGTSGYAASKGAQLALTREWAVELLNDGIRVNAIIPAEVMTPLYENWLSTFENPKEKLKEIVANIPLERRMTTTTEIASMTAFLLSDRASHMTGQFLFVDGGYVHLDRSLAGLNGKQDLS